MSKLTELLDELCPDGVAYRPLGELLAIRDSERRPVTKSDRVSGPYPYYGANGIQDYVNEYIFDGEFILLGEDGSVLTDDFRPVTTWAAGKIWVNNHAHVLAAKSDEISLRFSYYALTSTDIRQFVSGGSRAKLNQSGLRLIPLPVPLLEVQQEIVRVLDAFTDLEQSLVSELELRKKQLVAQRERLLSGGTKFSTLGENFSMKAGKFVKASEIAQNPSDENPYPCYGANGLRGYVSHMTHEGDYVLVGRQGALSGNTIRVSGCFAATEHAVVVSPLELDDFDIDWIYHKLTAMNLNQYVTKGAQPGLSVRTLQRVPISIDTPPLQRSVAESLGLFEALIQSIEQEISLRRKQYEFYRDELLSFAPKEA